MLTWHLFTNAQTVLLQTQCLTPKFLPANTQNSVPNMSLMQQATFFTAKL